MLKTQTVAQTQTTETTRTGCHFIANFLYATINNTHNAITPEIFPNRAYPSVQFLLGVGSNRSAASFYSYGSIHPFHPSYQPTFLKFILIRCPFRHAQQSIVIFSHGVSPVISKCFQKLDHNLDSRDFFIPISSFKVVSEFYRNHLLLSCCCS